MTFFFRRERVQSSKNKYRAIILVLFVIVFALAAYIISHQNQTQEKVDETQSEYVKPEEPIDRSKNVSLPGWGGFTIPANKTEITEGFEFHNPAENFWYEDVISVGGEEVENLVVDSGNQVEFNHYLSLAGKAANVTKVLEYDKDVFSVSKNEDQQYVLEAIKGFEGKKTIVVKTDNGKKVKLTVQCKEERYYLKFALYLSENDELLYQSDLVSPGKYIQKMKMSRALKAGTYDAYVKIQPYKSDKKTETNQGVVRITLTVK